MKIKALIMGLVLASVSSLGIDVATHQHVLGQPTAQLNWVQIRQLKSAGMRIAAPNYIPLGFQIDSIRILTNNNFDNDYKGYAILYKGSANACFAIEAASGGIGAGAELDRRLSINSKLFGKSYSLNYGRYTDPQMRQQFPEPFLYTDWMKGKGNYYRLVGATLTRESYNKPKCREIDPQQALQIVESMKYIN